MPQICVSELGHHWFRFWLVACSAPSHYLNQCWFIVDWTPGNKFQWNLHGIISFSFKKMHLKNRLPKMVAILSRWRWVNLWIPGWCGTMFYCILLKFIIQNSSLGTRYETALRWMPQNLSDEKSILVQVMAWCCQELSHYLSQCWPRSM